MMTESRVFDWIFTRTSLWQLASYSMQPPLIRDVGMTTFAVVSVPSPAMVFWAVGYILVALAIAMRLLSTRDL
jgi:hypothetical protein